MVKILRIREQQLKLNNDIELTKGKQIEIGLAPILLINNDNDTFAIRTQVVYSFDKKLLMGYAVLVVFAADGWKQELKSLGEEKIKSSANIQHALGMAIGTLRGALAIRTMNSKIENIYLPDISSEDLIKDLEVKNVDA